MTSLLSLLCFCRTDALAAALAAIAYHMPGWRWPRIAIYPDGRNWSDCVCKCAWHLPAVAVLAPL